MRITKRPIVCLEEHEKKSMLTTADIVDRLGHTMECEVCPYASKCQVSKGGDINEDCYYLIAVQVIEDMVEM